MKTALKRSMVVIALLFTFLLAFSPAGAFFRIHRLHETAVYSGTAGFLNKGFPFSWAPPFGIAGTTAAYNAAYTVLTNYSPADGATANRVEMHLTDALGDALPNEPVVFSVGAGGNPASITSTQPLLTDNAGNVKVSFTAALPGNVELTATVNGQPVSSSVTTIFSGEPDVTNANTTLQALTSVVTAGSTAKVKAHIADALGNPVPFATVSFTYGNGTPITSDVITDADGNAILQLGSTAAFTANVTAVVNGHAIVNGSPATVQFTAGPPDVNQSTFTVTKDLSRADGNEQNEVTVQLYDAYANKVTGYSVALSLTSGTATFAGNTTTFHATTGSDGKAVAVLSSQVVGAVSVAATVNNGTPLRNSPRTMHFVAYLPDAAKSSLAVDKGSAAADGNDADEVTASIFDAGSNAIANQPVTFTIASGTAVFTNGQTSILLNTGSDGKVPGVKITSQVAGTVTIAAAVNGTAIANSPATVIFTAGAPVAAASVLSITRNGGVADGTGTNGMKATLKDASGNLVQGAQVVFAVVAGTGAFTNNQQTIAIQTSTNGETPEVPLSSTVIGTVQVTAAVNGAVIASSPATLQFVGGAPAVASSELTIIRDNAVADGREADAVIAIIRDASGNALANQQVAFAIVSGSAAFANGRQTTTAVTGSNGETPSVPLSTVISGPVQITATLNGVQVAGSPVTVHFVERPPDVTASQLVVVQDGATADGHSINTIKAVIRDPSGNVLANQPIVFTIISGSAAFSNGQQTYTASTRNSGETFNVPLSTLVAGEVKVSATLNGTEIGGSPVTLHFVAGQADVSASTLAVVSDNAIADGHAANTVKAMAQDAFGNLSPNQAVVFTIASGTAAFSNGQQTITVQTGSNGETPLVPLSSTVTGLVQVGASIGGTAIVSSPVTLHFQVSPPAAGASVLSVTVNNAIADGHAANTVKAVIKDAAGNPQAGQQVELSITSGTAAFSNGQQTITVQTGSNGETPDVPLSSTVAGTVEVAASLNGTAIGNSPAAVHFVAGTPSATGSSLVVTVDNVVADGHAANAVKALLKDALGNAVSGQPVLFSITGGTAAFSNGQQTITVQTGSNGETPGVPLSSTVEGVVQVAASFNGTSVSSSPVTVHFIAVPPTPGSSVLVVITDNALANGVAANTVAVRLNDANGKPIVARQVVFSIIEGTAGFAGGVTTVTLVTDSKGEILVPLFSTTAGMAKVSAVINGNTLQPVQIHFMPILPDPVKSTLTVTANNAPAGGTAANGVTASILDATGSLMPGVPVTFTITGGQGTFSNGQTSITVNTGANGLTGMLPVSSPVAGTVTISATVNGTAITGSPASLYFTGKPDTNNPLTALQVVVNNAFADGVTANSVQAHITDVNGHPLTDQAVRFTIIHGTATITTRQPVATDANGNAVIELVSAASGNVEVTATVEGAEIRNGSPARLRFVAMDILVPKVFTPNGDGVNDVLKPIVIGMTSLQSFNIYNRWGNLLFTGRSASDGWDGNYKGAPQPPETYLWVANGTDRNGKPTMRKGLVTLAR